MHSRAEKQPLYASKHSPALIAHHEERSPILPYSIDFVYLRNESSNAFCLLVRFGLPLA
jgi:hypothetical protein